jgi:hypothetical protein
MKCTFEFVPATGSTPAVFVVREEREAREAEEAGHTIVVEYSLWLDAKDMRFKNGEGDEFANVGALAEHYGQEIRQHLSEIPWKDDESAEAVS